MARILLYKFRTETAAPRPAAHMRVYFRFYADVAMRHAAMNL